jgi:Tfp pilus assembly protein PilV
MSDTSGFARRRRVGDGVLDADAGITLVEMLVTIVLLTVALLGLLAELATDVKQQSVEKTQLAAVHVADGWLEAQQAAARTDATFVALSSGAGTSSVAVNGVTYHELKAFETCSATDQPPTTCNTPSDPTLATTYATITVSWSIGNSSHDVSMTRSLADNATHQTTDQGNPLSSCNASGTSVTGTLTLVPVSGPQSRVDLNNFNNPAVDTTGAPVTSVNATLNESGLSAATCVPLTWADDNGTHQVDMHTTGSGSASNCPSSVPCIYTASIPATDVTRAVGATTWDGTVVFTATLPGASATQTLFLNNPPTLSCSVTTAGLSLDVVSLNPLTGNKTLLLKAGLACTTTHTISTDSVTVQYRNGAGTLTQATLTSANGTTWSGSLGSGASMLNTGQSFAFTVVRASDSRTVVNSVPVGVLL